MAGTPVRLVYVHHVWDPSKILFLPFCLTSFSRSLPSGMTKQASSLWKKKRWDLTLTKLHYHMNSVNFFVLLSSDSRHDGWRNRGGRAYRLNSSVLTTWREHFRFQAVFGRFSLSWFSPFSALPKHTKQHGYLFSVWGRNMGAPILCEAKLLVVYSFHHIILFVIMGLWLSTKLRWCGWSKLPSFNRMAPRTW